METPGISPSVLRAGSLPEASWGALIPPEQWTIFEDGVSALEGGGVPFLLHGAKALATYTGHWRNTKDVDVVVHTRDRQSAIDALRRAAFDDYHATLAYDRSWIFRGIKNDVLFDVIWELPNHRVPIDDAWFQRSQPINLRGRVYAAVPPEELVRVKLYVMQRERCDWVDVLNTLAGAADRIDWRWLVQRMGHDRPLLHAALAIFNWMSPGRAESLPDWVREQFALPRIEPEDPAAMEVRRVRLFDTRPWFAAHQPINQPLPR